MKKGALLLLLFPAISIELPAQNTDANSFDSLIPNGAWSRNFTVPGLTGQDGFAPVVYDFARGKDGRVLAAGRFRWFGDRSVDPLVRRSEGNWRSAKQDWDREVPEIGFSAIAVNDAGAMALSTNSGPFGSAPVEIWLVSDERTLVIGHLRGAVRSMVWFQDRLWVAGFFQLSEGGVSNLAVWNGRSWSGPPGGAADRAVYRLNLSGDSLLLAGDFSTVGGIPASGIAEWNGQSWKAYDLAPSVDASHVYSVARDDNGVLYAGGAITGGIVRWTGSGWEPLGGGVALSRDPGVVGDLVMHRGDLYVTGCFSHVNGPPSDSSSIRAQSVARWRGSRWESLDDGSQGVASSWFDYGVCGFEPNEFTIWDVRFQRLFSDGDRVYLGGMFPGVAGKPSQSIVSFDGETWRAEGRAEDGLSGAAYALTSGGPSDAVYAMGGISHAGETARTSGVFRFEKEWVAVGGPFPQGVNCSRLAVDRAGEVFVACNTPVTPALQSQLVVLRQDAGNWVQIATPGLAGLAQDLRFDPAGRLWIAGGVRTGDATGSGFLARLDGGEFKLVEGGFDSMVFRIAFEPGSTTGEPDLVVGGAFTRTGSGAFERIARLRQGQWESIGAGLSTAVSAVAWAESGLYVATERPTTPDKSHLLFGRWDGSLWTELGTPENGLPAPRERTVYTIRDLYARGRYVIAAGSLYPETGGSNAFVYDGTRISPLDGGLSAIAVDSVALAGDGLWFGGQIAEAGFGEERIPSIGIARFSMGER